MRSIARFACCTDNIVRAVGTVHYSRVRGKPIVPIDGSKRVVALFIAYILPQTIWSEYANSQATLGCFCAIFLYRLTAPCFGCVSNLFQVLPVDQQTVSDVNNGIWILHIFGEKKFVSFPSFGSKTECYKVGNLPFLLHSEWINTILGKRMIWGLYRHRSLWIYI